jgi:hypothetical protein
MALRRNPPRCCQEVILPMISEVKLQSTTIDIKKTPRSRKERLPVLKSQARRPVVEKQRRKQRTACQPLPPRANDKPFPFLKLPRELRDQVYSYLVTRPNKRSVLPAVSLLNGRKRQVKRARLNERRILSGRLPVRMREEPEPTLHLQLLQASKILREEVKDYLYSNNWFTITLDKLPLTTFETPFGWDLGSITRLQVELQLKDAAHMNSYVDWTTLFSSFTSLRFLHVAPTFHPRYYEWARSELSNWTTAHYVHKAFFRELFAAIPKHVDIKADSSPEDIVDFQLQGKCVGEALRRDIYVELGARHCERRHRQ